MGFGLRDINRTHKAIMFENKKVERALRLFHCTATMCIQLSFLIFNNRPSWVLCTVLTKFNENVIQYKISRFICIVYTIWQACANDMYIMKVCSLLGALIRYWLIHSCEIMHKSIVLVMVTVKV